MATKYELTSYQEDLFNEICLRLPKDKELSNLLEGSRSIEIPKKSVHKTKFYRYLRLTKKSKLTFKAVKALIRLDLDFVETQKKIFINSFGEKAFRIIQHRIMKEIRERNFSMIISNQGLKYVIVGNIILTYSHHRREGVKYDI